MKIGYVRTSTLDQHIDRQMNQLKEICDEVFVEDGVSAVAKNRPVYEHVLSILTPGDTFVVHTLDRAFRSVIDALTEVAKMQERGVEFRSLSQQIDIDSPEGLFNFTMRAASAQLERSILSIRTKEGLEAARRRGKILGRPRKLSEAQIEWAKSKVNPSECGNSLMEISKVLRVSQQTLRRALKMI